ncbi:hypothetical protein LTR84_005778 [Exophiala bonariae]|uniref:Epoxide hydrolase N-terminal domain-containing protein n=1 Tax=Exophiala bonariae TaxID=1690606 RepID=A0AAV9N6S5_9EURO|nr:hypothetical protein LTR84_005778 [Exophiala bonariae]
MQKIVAFWRDEYDWRAEEARLNALGPQFQTDIDIDGLGTINLHFLHAKSKQSNAIPLLFIHGWPGSFNEVSGVLPLFLEAGFDVVAPSLPGYGFSSYPDIAGFSFEHCAAVFSKLMGILGYESYVIQGGDWGSDVGRTMSLTYPKNIVAYHANTLPMSKPDFGGKEPAYSKFEQALLDRMTWFEESEWAYYSVQATKPRTFGYALHDSPVGMLAWMADKLFLWAEDYDWTYTEIITWTLLHYFPGPTTGMQWYADHPNFEMLDKDAWLRKTYLEVPTGFSAFPKEIGMGPRSWAETIFNVQFWREHPIGGHFAAYERPNELGQDAIEFFQSIWEKKASKLQR